MKTYSTFECLKTQSRLPAISYTSLSDMPDATGSKSSTLSAPSNGSWPIGTNLALVLSFLPCLSLFYFTRRFGSMTLLPSRNFKQFSKRSSTSPPNSP